MAVYGCREVAADFHPRYMAAGKRYVYRIWNAPARNPFWQGYALHRQRRLDERRMNKAAADYLGTHDFTAFCSAGSAVEDRVRTVRHCRVSREGDLVTFAVEADGFLYNMVRIMIGTLLDMASRPHPMGRPAGYSVSRRPGQGGRYRPGLRAVSGRGVLSRRRCRGGFDAACARRNRGTVWRINRI